MNYKAVITGILESDLAGNKADFADHEAMKEMLVPHHGKIFNGRVTKKFPAGWSAQSKAGQLSVISPSGRMHYVGWLSNPIIDVHKLDDVNAPNGRGALDRITKLETILGDNDKIDELIKTFTDLAKAWAAFKKIACIVDEGCCNSYLNPSYYTILRELEVPSKVMSEIRFDKHIPK